MFVNKLLLISVLVIAGCATNPEAVVPPKEVKVPVAVPCETAIPQEPEFNFPKISEQDDIFVKVKALLADIKLHLAYEEQLLAALKSCK